MGMELVVTYPPGRVPDWPALSGTLAAAGFPATPAMIDGQLAFPDEEPPPNWAELRLRTPQGMVTVRRGEGSVTCVTWGNADAALRQAWQAVAWACAAAGGGTVETPQGRVDADAYRRTADLPDALRGS
jgi:hypothetical protein